jgi:Leu/Phe-tRNA-protein transferase
MNTIRVELSVDERELILEHVMLCSSVLEEKIRKKRSRHGYVTLDLSREEVMDLLGCLASEANHTSKKWLADELDPIFESLEGLLYAHARNARDQFNIQSCPSLRGGD